MQYLPLALISFVLHITVDVYIIRNAAMK